MKATMTALLALGQWSILALIGLTWLIFVPGLAILVLSQLLLG